MYSALGNLQLVQAATRASNYVFSDYKALVCVFLYGGNDTNNTVVPLDDYAQYAAVRGGSSVALSTGQLTRNPKFRRDSKSNCTPVASAIRDSCSAHRTATSLLWRVAPIKSRCCATPTAMANRM